VSNKHGIHGWLCRLFGCRKGRKKKLVFFEYSIGLAISKTERQNMLELKITNEQKIPVELKPVTAAGKPAELDGKPAVSVVAGDSTFEQSEDGKTITLISSDTPGDTQFLIEADADLGEGVETISDIVKLTVEGAKAASLGLVAGTAVPK